MNPEFSRDFNHTLIFKALPPVNQVYYKNQAPSGASVLECEAEPTSFTVRLLEIIHAPEKPLWESVKEMTGFAIKDAESRLFGTFSLDLVTVGDRSKWRSLEVRNLADLLVNHGRTMNPGDEKFFPFASLWFLFKKRVPADWGTIRFQHPMNVYTQERGKFDLLVKKQLQEAEADELPVWIVIRDFSQEPVFRFGEEPQTERLLKFLTRQKECFSGKIRGVHVVTETGTTDLVQQFEILKS